MRVRAKKQFFSQQLGDFDAGRVYEVPSGFASKWIAMGLVESVKPIPVLLQTKPEIISVETKPSVIAVETKTRKRRVKAHENHHAANV
jgi:hypothetical protein